jgi:hypothetical protein
MALMALMACPRFASFPDGFPVISMNVKQVKSEKEVVDLLVNNRVSGGL